MADNIEEVYLNTGVADGPNGERIINFEDFRAAVDELLKREREKIKDILRRSEGVADNKLSEFYFYELRKLADQRTAQPQCNYQPHTIRCPKRGTHEFKGMLGEKFYSCDEHKRDYLECIKRNGDMQYIGPARTESGE